MTSKAKEAEISEFEWNFDSVPDKELLACCYWEYARESAFIRDAHLRRFVGGERCGVEFARIRGCGTYPRLIVDEFFEGGFFPKPWQALPKTQRQKGILPWNHNKPTPFERGHWVEAETVQESAHEFLQQLPPGMLRGVCPTDEPSSFCSEVQGCEVGVFRIYWRHCTNEEIIEGFRAWVNSGNRPACFQLRQGRPLGGFSARSALDGLAILRLLHHFKPSELEVKRFKVCTRNRRRQFAARIEAVKRFEAMYPFGERPLSFATKAGRSK